METYDKQYLSDYNTATHKEKIKQRIHILSAVMWAQEHHNQIMYLVDSAKDKACFQEMLMEHYYFDREQACAISDMRMSVYTALEKDRTKKGNTGIINENVIIRKWRVSDGIKTIRYDKQI